MKTLKLPTFNEDKDDLDAYLNRFERACQAYAVKPENWSIQLARLLQGRALEVYQRLADSDVTSYEKLKEGLLKWFKLSEGEYRSRFKKSRLENGETAEQFVERIRKYLRKWHETANVSGVKCQCQSLGLSAATFFNIFFIVLLKFSATPLIVAHGMIWTSSWLLNRK